MSKSPKVKLPLEVDDIQRIIPHRFPFLLVDRIVELDEEAQRVVAIKNVTINEPYFQGHYPGRPVMPGVLQIEAMAQAVCVYLLLSPRNEGKVPLFAGIDGVRFRRQVAPGDQLRIEGQMTRMKSRAAKCQARCTVDGELVVEALLTCVLSDAE